MEKPDTSHSAQAGAIRQDIDDYVLVRLLGSGGMGAVYEAKQKLIERRVAIKILHPTFSDDDEVMSRFKNEARIVNIIGHPGLIAVTSFGVARSGAHYIVMEYIDGQSLREHIKKSGGRLGVDEVIYIARQIASTLAVTHDKKVVHRDLKPSNVMLQHGDDGGEATRVKILDFGIAKLGNESMSQTKTGVLLGTPTYMSPEQCRSGRKAIDRSDVYALGIIMYELLTGEPPIVGPAAMVMAGHIMQEPPSLSTVAPATPAPLVALIHRMLAKPSGDRPSAAEVARELATLHGRSVSPSQAYAVLPSGGSLSPIAGLGLLGEPAAGVALPAAPAGALRRQLVLVGAVLLSLLGLFSGLLLWSLLRTPKLPGEPTGPAVGAWADGGSSGHPASAPPRDGPRSAGEAGPTAAPGGPLPGGEPGSTRPGSATREPSESAALPAAKSRAKKKGEHSRPGSKKSKRRGPHRPTK